MSIRVNPTRVHRYLRCEYDWYCYSVLGIEPRKAAPSEHLDRGKAVHALVEHAVRHYAQTGEVFAFEGQAGWVMAHAIYEKLYNDDGCVLSEETSHEVLNAVRYQIPRLDLPTWEVLKTESGEPFVEIELRTEWEPGIELHAIIDAVMRHRASGKLWHVNWKTTSKAIDATQTHVQHHLQLALERQLLAIHGIAVDYSAIVKLRSLAPQPPAMVNKGKRVSTDKSKLACDWQTYRDALVANGEDPDSESALAVRDHLSGVAFSRWLPDITTKAAHEEMIRQFTRIAQRMSVLAKHQASPLRVLDNTFERSRCGKCDYQKWCAASLDMPSTGKPKPFDRIDTRLLGVDYIARDSSPLKDFVNYEVAPPQTSAYVEWARQQGRELEPCQEFKP